MKLPPEAVFNLRVPLKYASLYAAVSLQRDFHTISIAYMCLKRLVSGPYIYVGSGFYLSPDGLLNVYSQLTGEDSYRIIVMGVQRLHVEIVSDAPPSPDDPP